MWAGAAGMIGGVALGARPERRPAVPARSFAAVERVVIRSGADTLNIRGTEADEARVAHTTLSGRPRLRQRMDGSTLELRVDCGFLFFSRCRMRLDVAVPSGVDVVARGGSGRAAVEGLRGDVTLAGGSGDAVVRDVTGTVDVARGSGDVAISLVRGDVRVNTGSGDARIDDVAGDVEFHAGSGDLKAAELRAPRFEATTGSGSVVAAFPEAPDEVTVRTGSGKVELRVPSGAYDLDIETRSGDEDTSRVTDDDDSPRRLEVATGSGDVSIEGDPA